MTPTTLLAPYKGRAYTLHPLFQWSNSNGKIKSYKFTLLDFDRTTVLYEHEVAGNSFKYPNDAPALIPGGTYFWSAGPSASTLGDPAEPAQLMIVGGQPRSELDALLASAPEDSLDRARIFVDKRLWYDAVEAYTHLISAHPADSQYLLDRAELYEQLPQTKEAAQRDLANAETAAH